MNNSLRHVLFYKTLFLQFLFTETFAQINEIFHDSTPKVGFVFGYGGQEFDHFFRNDSTKRKNQIASTITQLGINPDKIDLHVDYVYINKFYQFQYYITLVEKESWGIELLTQPQLNIAEFKDFAHSTKKHKSFEFGLNMGNKFYYTLLDETIQVFLILTSGPHYVSDVPQRQKRGFIFSNSIFIGLSFSIDPNIFFEIRPGFRHISNVFWQPNGGLNSYVVSAGFSVQLDRPLFAKKKGLNIKPEVHHIAVLHDIVFPFHAHFACLFDFGFGL